MHEHRCLVCGYEGDAQFYPRDYMICGCCGTEFGYDDRVLDHAELRRLWVLAGCPWFDADEPRPETWDPYIQLANAGFISPVQALGATAREFTVTFDSRTIGRFIRVRTHARNDPALYTARTETTAELELVAQ